jgi:hypothetical protein
LRERGWIREEAKNRGLWRERLEKCQSLAKLKMKKIGGTEL